MQIIAFDTSRIFEIPPSLSLSKIFSILILNLFFTDLQDTNLHFPRKRPSKNDLRRPFISHFHRHVSKLSSPQFPQSRMYRQKSYRQPCSVKRPHVSERFIHVEGPRNVSSTLSRSPCSRWQDVRSGDCAKPRFPVFDSTVGGNPLDEGNQEGSFVEIPSSPLAPSLSQDGNDVGGGILLPAVARAKVVPLSSRATHAAKIYLPLCPFPLYRVSRLHGLRRDLHISFSTLFHPIDFISSGTYHLFYSYTRLDVKKTRENPIPLSISF